MYWNFVTMTSLLWRHLYLVRSQSVQYFVFCNSQVLNSIAKLNEKSEQNKSNKQTCLNVEH